MSGWSYTQDELVNATGGVYSGEPFTFSSVSKDTRTIKPGDLYFALSGEKFDGNDFSEDALSKGACAAVTTRDVVSGKCVVVPDVQRALQDLASHHRSRFDLPVMAITGSCGKTSCKELISAVLSTKFNVVKTQGNLNNEIGCPLSILQIDDTTDFVVLEMGANHHGEIARLCEIARPTESTITMVGAAHLEGFGSLDDVAKAKSEIMSGLPESGRYYINADDPRCVAVGEQFPGQKIRFGAGGDVSLREWAFDHNGDMVLDIDPIGTLRLPLYVPAHAQNVLLAVAVGLQHGVTEFQDSLSAACRNATRFKVYTRDGIEIIDDTYNANPSSMEVAFEALGARPGSGARIAVLGAMLELGPQSAELHRKTGTALGKHGITKVLVRGPFANELVAGAIASGVASAAVVEDHAEMASELASVIQKGDTLLFKGSRGMAMEKAIEALADTMGWTAP